MTSKKHYIAVANKLKRRREAIKHHDNKLHALFMDSTVTAMAQDLCEIYANENPAFDEARFMKAIEV